MTWPRVLSGPAPVFHVSSLLPLHRTLDGESPAPHRNAALAKVVFSG